MQYNEIQWTTMKYNELVMKYNEILEIQWNSNAIQRNTMK